MLVFLGACARGRDEGGGRDVLLIYGFPLSAKQSARGFTHKIIPILQIRKPGSWRFRYLPKVIQLENNVIGIGTQIV